MVGQLGDVEVAVLIERDFNWFEDVGFRCKQFDAEAVHHLERVESLVTIERLAVG